MDIAIDQKHDNIVKYLQQTQLDLNKQLLVAVQDNNLNKVKDLVSRGADVNMQYGNGRTPLYLAVLEGYLDVIKYLTDKGADINVDVFRRKLIHIATANNHKDIIEFLLSKGVSVNDTDGSGQTPLHYAASQGYLEVTKFLIEQGADINAKDNGGKTPMDIAIDRKHDNIVKYSQQTQLDLNKQLLTAVQDNNLNKVKDLVSRGADVNMQYGNGWTPLHCAALEDYFVIVKYLIENNANIDAKNNIGRTSLHNAARNGHLDVVKYLIEKGADFEIKDEDDKTPLGLASRKEHNDVVKYLEEIKEEREKPVQRKRRHHHGDYSRHHNHLSGKLIDSSNQPEIAASGSIRPSSWINDLFSWVKGSVGGFRAVLPEETSSTTSSILQVDAPIDVNGTIMLLDVLIRKVTGQKYISTSDQPISPLGAQGYALNIIKGFEKVVEQAAKDSKISMHRLNIDSIEIQKEITKRIIGGKFNEIPGVLNSYVEKACPDIEAGYTGKLSSKKFGKFMLEFNSRLNVVLNQSIQQILNRNNTLEVSDVKEQRISLEPRSYLNNSSVQSHLTQARDLGLR